MRDWRGEDEFRWVLFTDTESDLLFDFEDSLVGVVFGENTREKDIDTILKMTETSNVEYTGIKWKNCISNVIVKGSKMEAFSAM